MNNEISDELISKASEFIIDKIKLIEIDNDDRIVIIKQYYENQWLIDIGEYVLLPEGRLISYEKITVKCAYESHTLSFDDGLAFDNPEKAYQFYKDWKCNRK